MKEGQDKTGQRSATGGEDKKVTERRRRSG